MMSHCISLVFSASLSLFATQDYNIILYLELGIYSYSIKVLGVALRYRQLLVLYDYCTRTGYAVLVRR